MSGPWREGNGGAWSQRPGRVSDPDAESENRDQEGQRDSEEDEVDRWYTAVDDRGRRQRRGMYDIALATGEDCGA